MNSPKDLWAQYHEAVKRNNPTLAQAILNKLQSYTSYPQNRSGCSHCRRKL